MKIKHEIELKPFDVPEFVTTVGPPGRRQDGFNPNALRINLKDLDESVLEELCNNWLKSVYAKAEKELVLKDKHGRVEIWENGEKIAAQG